MKTDLSTFKRGLLAILLALTLVPAAPAGAQLISASGNPGGVSTTTDVDFVGVGWELVADVTWDPDARPWIKRLQAPPAGDISHPPYWLTETLTVVGHPWTDWHEEILTPGWEWTTTNSISVGGQVILGLLSSGNTQIDFFFPFPVVEGTTIFVEKELDWTGVGNPVYPIEILEYPTIPEPASLLLLGSGLVGLIGLNRKWRKT